MGTVHTSGVNWESIAVIAVSVMTIVGGFTTWISRQITHAIKDLSVSLEAKLETKEVVNGINIRLTIIEQTLRDRTP
jgi:hypothetical protein